MTRGGLSSPYPSQWTSGTQSSRVKQCHRTLWRPGIAPWTLKVLLGTLPSSLRGDPGPPTADQEDDNALLGSTNLRIFTSLVPFCIVWRNNLCRNAIKTNLISTIFKIHFSLRFLIFSSEAAPRAPQRPILESDLAILGSQGPPLKL